MNRHEIRRGRRRAGGRIRASLKGSTGSGAIPQIFLGGEFVGDCTEIFALTDEGDLEQRLKGLGVLIGPAKDVNLPSLLPQWLAKAAKQAAV